MAAVTDHIADYRPDYGRLYRNHAVLAVLVPLLGPALGMAVIWTFGSFTAATWDIGQWTSASRGFAGFLGFILGILFTFALFVVLDYYAVLYERWREEARERHGAWLEDRAKPDVRDRRRRMNL